MGKQNKYRNAIMGMIHGSGISSIIHWWMGYGGFAVAMLTTAIAMLIILYLVDKE